MLTLYGFGRVNPMVVGITRDLRVLWALEVLGLPYRVHGVDHPAGELQGEEYRRRNPFTQVRNLLDDDGFVLTESGAILLYGAADPTGAQRRPWFVQWAERALGSLQDALGDRVKSRIVCSCSRGGSGEEGSLGASFSGVWV